MELASSVLTDLHESVARLNDKQFISLLSQVQQSIIASEPDSIKPDVETPPGQNSNYVDALVSLLVSLMVYELHLIVL